MRRAAALLAALVLACTPVASGADPGLREDAAFTWRDRFEGFGSFSGLWVSPDGSEFATVTDKGWWASGRLVRDDGRLVAVETDASGRLLDPVGNALAGRDVDAEGLARDAGGRFYVSFEAKHRVWAYDTLGGPAEAIEGPREFRGLQNNSSLEALAITPDGMLMTAPERSGRLDRPFPVYALKDGRWSVPFQIPRMPPHLVAGADVGPDGRLYLLERDFQGLLGFSSRIRSFALDGGTLSDERVLVTTPLATYDNLEGIATWRDADGRIRLTLISDDNNHFLQRTQFVEFVVTD